MIKTLAAYWKVPRMIESNEKFALVALPRTALADSIANLVLPNGVSVTRTLPLPVEEHWKKWIGEIRTKYLQEAGCYFLVTGKAEKPEVLDADNQILMQRIYLFLDALFIVETPYCAANPLLVTGANVSGEISIRQLVDLARPIRRAYREHTILRELEQRDFEQASVVADSLSNITRDQKSYTRLKRAISAFKAGLNDERHEERLHQFCRCVDGIIISDKGSGKKDFKKRTAMFFGSGHEAIADEIYEMRSAVEHLRSAETEAVGCVNLEARRRRVIERAVQAEVVARHCITRILSYPQLTVRFENDDQTRQDNFGAFLITTAVWSGGNLYTSIRI